MNAGLYKRLQETPGSNIGGEAEKHVLVLFRSFYSFEPVTKAQEMVLRMETDIAIAAMNNCDDHGHANLIRAFFLRVGILRVGPKLVCFGELLEVHGLSRGSNLDEDASFEHTQLTQIWVLTF